MLFCHEREVFFFVRFTGTFPIHKSLMHALNTPILWARGVVNVDCNQVFFPWTLLDLLILMLAAVIQCSFHSIWHSFVVFRSFHALLVPTKHLLKIKQSDKSKFSGGSFNPIRIYHTQYTLTLACTGTLVTPSTLL